jgi:hypothetical protein
LGFPERVYSTLVRAAKTSETFKDVTFHLRPASPAKHVSFATLPAPATRSAKKISSPPRPLPLPTKHEKLKQVQRSAVIAKPQPQPRKTPQLQPTSASLTPKPQTAQPSPPVQEKSKRLQHFEPADITHSQPPPAPVSSSDPLDVLRPYLPEENKDTSILRLSPASRPPLSAILPSSSAQYSADTYSPFNPAPGSPSASLPTRANASINASLVCTKPSSKKPKTSAPYSPSYGLLLRRTSSPLSSIGRSTLTSANCSLASRPSSTRPLTTAGQSGVSAPSSRMQTTQTPRPVYSTTTASSSADSMRKCCGWRISTAAC